jgi:chromosome segregation ATPase
MTDIAERALRRTLSMTEALLLIRELRDKLLKMSERKTKFRIEMERSFVAAVKNVTEISENHATAKLLDAALSRVINQIGPIDPKTPIMEIDFSIDAAIGIFCFQFLQQLFPDDFDGNKAGKTLHRAILARVKAMVERCENEATNVDDATPDAIDAFEQLRKRRGFSAHEITELVAELAESGDEK